MVAHCFFQSHRSIPGPPLFVLFILKNIGGRSSRNVDVQSRENTFALPNSGGRFWWDDRCSKAKITCGLIFLNEISGGRSWWNDRFSNGRITCGDGFFKYEVRRCARGLDHLIEKWRGTIRRKLAILKLGNWVWLDFSYKKKGDDLHTICNFQGNTLSLVRFFIGKHG